MASTLGIANAFVVGSEEEEELFKEGWSFRRKKYYEIRAVRKAVDGKAAQLVVSPI